MFSAVRTEMEEPAGNDTHSPCGRRSSSAIRAIVAVVAIPLVQIAVTLPRRTSSPGRRVDVIEIDRIDLIEIEVPANAIIILET